MTTDKFYRAMSDHGFSQATTDSVRKDLTCPRCGFVFSLVYARAIACQGCSEASRGCPKVRCNKCDFEFPIRQSASVRGDKVQERVLSDHICTIVNRRNDSLGVSHSTR